MNLHKERIAQLRELRAAVSKPTTQNEKGGTVRRARWNDSSLSKDSQSTIPTNESASKPSVHDKALRLLFNEGTEEKPSRQAAVEQTIATNPNNNNNSKNPIHRKLQATVQLLSESLEEQGHLKALLEITTQPTNFDILLQHLNYPSDDVIRELKIRSLMLEKDKLLSQVRIPCSVLFPLTLSPPTSISTNRISRCILLLDN